MSSLPIKAHIQDMFHRPGSSPPRKAIDVKITAYNENYQQPEKLPNYDSEKLSTRYPDREAYTHSAEVAPRSQSQYNSQSYNNSNQRYEDEIDKIIKLNTVG